MIPERQSGFAIVGNFWHAHEAHLAQMYLESQDVPAWVLDEHQVRMRWDLAAAIGGVKLAVRPEDAERARILLSQDHSADLDGIPEQELSPASDERCPRCGVGTAHEARASKLPAVGQWLLALFSLSLGFLVPGRRVSVRRSCPACLHTWSTLERR